LLDFLLEVKEGGEDEIGAERLDQQDSVSNLSRCADESRLEAIVELPVSTRERVQRQQMILSPKRLTSILTQDLRDEGYT
jgi:hypothetical protein